MECDCPNIEKLTISKAWQIQRIFKYKKIRIKNHKQVKEYENYGLMSSIILSKNLIIFQIKQFNQ